jgi:hypothetical protein
MVESRGVVDEKDNNDDRLRDAWAHIFIGRLIKEYIGPRGPPLPLTCGPIYSLVNQRIQYFYFFTTAYFGCLPR